MLHATCLGFDVVMSVRKFENNAPFSQRAFLSYTVITPSGATFTGDRYSPSPMVAYDSADSVISLLGWICVKPGDTDKDFFADYTPKQMDWAESFACEDYACMLGDFDGSHSTVITASDDYPYPHTYTLTAQIEGVDPDPTIAVIIEYLD